MNADQWIACKPGLRARDRERARAAPARSRQAAQAADVPAATLQALATALARCAEPFARRREHGARARGERAQSEVRQRRPLGAHREADRELRRDVDRRRAHGCDREDARGAGAARSSCAARIRCSRCPKSAKVADAMAKVAFKVSFSSYPDETSELCDLVLPDNHPHRVVGRCAAVRRRDLAAAAGNGSGVRHARHGRRVARRSAKGNPKLASTHSQTSYREYLIGRYPGGTTAFTSALIKGIGNGTLAGERAKRGPVATTRTAANIESTSGDFYPRRLSVAAARGWLRREQAVAAGDSRSGHEGVLADGDRGRHRRGDATQHRCRRRAARRDAGRRGHRARVRLSGAARRHDRDRLRTGAHGVRTLRAERRRESRRSARRRLRREVRRAGVDARPRSRSRRRATSFRS